MLALYIISGIILFIALVLVIPLKVKISLTDELKVYLYYGFLHFDLLKERVRKKPKPEPRHMKAEKNKPAKEEKTNFVRRMIDEKGVIGAFGYIKDGFVIPVLSELKKFSRRVSVKPLYFNLQFGAGGKDAADVALNYGKFCAGFYPLLGIIENGIKVKKQKINIGVDYTAAKHDIRFYIVLRTLPLHLTASGVRALIKIIIKTADTDAAKNERTVRTNGRQHQKHNGNHNGQA